MATERRIQVEAIAWLTGLIPLLAINVSYLISASAELVPWCFPYLEGCTSISKAGRYGTANHWVKATILPYTGVLMLYWWLAAEWLRGFAPDRFRIRRALFTLGEIGALFLILYATFLGVEGETYQWMRRYGITVHFSFTAFAQILLMSVLARDVRLPAWVRRAKVMLCAAMLFLGLISLPLQHWVSDRTALLNTIEWSYTLMMLSFFPLTGFAWRLTGFSFRTQQGV